ncbi:MAG TPA: LLM class flavin-dependent oxidoreductase, partial [Steroidobacteraceae bacterium]|nr:LLM class flavin-dependent oxidoreductase [Steroidobacteraceae bacterium]
MKLSILDLAHVPAGSNVGQALRNTLDLARHADGLGYTRFWLAEHHNMPGIASAATSVVIGQVAAVTQRIRVGAGGIMLPNHAPLVIAEQFGTLEALYPGRIDLGLGRAPGGDRLTASILNPSNTFNPKEYVQQIVDLKGYLSEEHEKGSVLEKVRAIPRITTEPALWMLTSSGESAYIAAHFGMALSFAQFINPAGGPEAIQAYRQQFKPSNQLQKPQAS